MSAALARFALQHRRWSALALYLVLTVAWTWPLATDPLGIDLSRHNDAPNTLAMAHGATQMDGTLRTFLFAWPGGQSLVRSDSFVYFLLAFLLKPLPVGAPMAFCILLGPVLSALAADRFAERLGARFPWTFVAGAAYGWSGVAATGVLDGYAYALLNPWLPLTGAFTLDALAGRPTAEAMDASDARPRPLARLSAPERAALLAAGAWFFALLNSAYSGINATLLVVTLVVGHLLRREAHRGQLRAAALLFGGIGLSGGVYSAIFLLAPSDAVRAAPSGDMMEAMMAAGSARLGTLLFRSETAELSMHSSGALIGVTALVLACFTPLLARGAARPRGMRRLGALAFVLILVSLGPILRVYASNQGIPFLMKPAAWWGIGAFIRFPERLLLVVTLIVGALAAVSVTRIATARPRGALLLLAAAALDAAVGSSPALRGGNGRWDAPSAYDATPAGRAVLDLWPRFFASSQRSDLRLTRRAIGYAALIDRPTLSDALIVSLAGDNRRAMADWLSARALATNVNGGEVRATLDAVGIGAVALHEQPYPPDALEALRSGLDALLGAPAARSVDAGDPVTLYVVATGAAPGTYATRMRAMKTALSDRTMLVASAPTGTVEDAPATGAATGEGSPASTDATGTATPAAP